MMSLKERDRLEEAIKKEAKYLQDQLGVIWFIAGWNPEITVEEATAIASCMVREGVVKSFRYA